MAHTLSRAALRCYVRAMQRSVRLAAVGSQALRSARTAQPRQSLVTRRSFARKSGLDVPITPQQERARARVAEAAPMKSAHVAGPRIAAFSKVGDPYWRSVMRKAPKSTADRAQTKAIFEAIEERGHESGEQRLLNKGLPRDSKVIPDKPGQGEHELSPEQIVQYVGDLNNDEPYNPNTNIVGLNKSLSHTIGVSAKTSGALKGVRAAQKPGLSLLEQTDAALKAGARGRIDEASLDTLVPHPPGPAFKTLDKEHRHPIEGEMEIKRIVGLAALGYRGAFPPDRRKPLQRYLGALADVTGSSPAELEGYDIETVTHDDIDPTTGEKFVSQRFTPKKEEV